MSAHFKPPHLSRENAEEQSSSVVKMAEPQGLKAIYNAFHSHTHTHTRLN